MTVGNEERKERHLKKESARLRPSEKEKKTVSASWGKKGSRGV
jgi:hypothetical protein